MTPQTNSVEVELDSRQRLPLARIVGPTQRRFRVVRLEGGDYLVTPVVSISERELAMLQNPVVRASLDEGIQQAASGEIIRHKRGHFTRLAERLGADED
jgi:hypothetical protein